MKIKKFSLILLLVMCLITNLFVFRLDVVADVPASQIVQSTTASFTQLPWYYYGVTSYYTVQDASNIPDSAPLNPVYFYTGDGVTFFSLSGLEVFTLALNQGVGVVLKTTKLTDVFNGFLDSLDGQVDLGTNLFIRGALFDSSNNFLGYCLNDISGCYYQPSSGQPSVTVPSDYVNNVNNYYNYYITQNPETVPYFTVVSPSYGEVLSATTVTGTTLNNMTNYFGSHGSDISFNSVYNTTNSSTICQLSQQGNVIYSISEDVYAISKATTGFDNMVYSLNLYSGTCYWNKLLYTNQYFTYQVYKSSDNSLIDSISAYNFMNGSAWTWGSFECNLGPTRYDQTEYKMMPIGRDLTIYRSQQDFNSINVSKTYSQDIYTSDSYNTFSTSNDNSITTNTTAINNAVTYNNNAYSTVSDNFYTEYVDNGVVNNNQITNEITTIINNYYSSENNQPDNPDNPDNPDDPDSPLDWSDLIELLKNLLEAIGAVIVGIFEGLISMITQVLEAIANIVSSLGGFTDFLSALFGFLPSPVPEIIAAGFSMCVLCAVIKFLRG